MWQLHARRFIGRLGCGVCSFLGVALCCSALLGLQVSGILPPRGALVHALSIRLWILLKRIASSGGSTINLLLRYEAVACGIWACSPNKVVADVQRRLGCQPRPVSSPRPRAWRPRHGFQSARSSVPRHPLVQLFVRAASPATKAMARICEPWCQPTLMQRSIGLTHHTQRHILVLRNRGSAACMRGTIKYWPC